MDEPHDKLDIGSIPMKPKVENSSIWINKMLMHGWFGFPYLPILGFQLRRQSPRTLSRVKKFFNDLLPQFENQ